ncbi:hypothetical protein [Tritonibacter mobilis]|uniref:hypothetical protein n=1 Tax=Tritonibacter mobilis TaxID=379347 RepID=UPI000806D9CE|nr:hypothetical protein [Tritonibacter mobilis]
MLVNIYARTMLNATRHSDLPQRPLPVTYRSPKVRPGIWRRIVTALIKARKETRDGQSPCQPSIATCK